MKLFRNIFKFLRKKKNVEIKRFVEEDSIKKLEKTKELFEKAFELYNTDNCQCSFPRFQQIIGINCSNTNYTFKCYDAELLIDISKPYFNISKSDLTDENVNETWTCKKCQSEYEFGWSDFSIHIDRQKLNLTNLKTTLIGKEDIKPIPIYLGLLGHSYPNDSEIEKVDFNTFKNYILEY